MKLIRIPSLVDNYIWLLIFKKNCVIIDPGIAEPVQQFLKKNTIQPVAILLTHHHSDHVDGIEELQKNYPKLIIYGPAETVHQGVTNIVVGGKQINIAGFLWQTFAVPGHTIGHIAYYRKPYLFCGDTLFSGGCGRIFEGTIKQMFHSIEILKVLPNETLLCCAHEYTAMNMEFASCLLPNDKAIKTYTTIVNKKQSKKQPTLPSQLKLEKKINVFLRTNDKVLQNALELSPTTASNYEVFAKLRKLKDLF